MPVFNTADLGVRLGLLWVGDTAEFKVAPNGKALVVRATITDKEQRAEDRSKQK
jgi:hypothetical protein